MTLLILHPVPAQAVPCNAPRCPCGGPGLAFPLTGGLPYRFRPQPLWWAPTGFRGITTGEA